MLVTGSRGQVGSELLRQGARLGWQTIGFDLPELDIAEPAAVSACMADVRPDAVINAAAYTAVDRAESERQIAFAVNGSGPGFLAAACAAAAIPLVHYSTDYVFAGDKKGAYLESDPVAPLGIYGASKLAGEEAVRAHCPQHLILRTSWVVSAFGHNFLKTMLRLGSERAELRVVADQIGKPTAAAELARLTLAALPLAAGRWGTYHVAQPQAVSWHGFAEAIFAEAHAQGMVLQVERVQAIASADYPTPARRPANSELDCRRFEEKFALPIRPWRESLAEIVGELNHV